MKDIFKGYQDQYILLDADIWTNHICVDHPEMTKDLITEVLITP